MDPVPLALLVPDRIIRNGIEGLIRQDGMTRYDIRIFDDFELFLRRSDTIDILLMDISSLRMSEVKNRMKWLTGGRQDVKVIAISSKLTAVYVHQVMQLGASGFIYRDELADALLNGLDLVRRDVATLSPRASQMLTTSKYLYNLNGIRPLDMQVLRLIARGLALKAIAAELDISTRSVYRSRDKLREILGIQNIETLIDAAREQGLLDLEDD
jgi:two-component system, NarL family, invasion response regulator UvrY